MTDSTCQCQCVQKAELAAIKALEVAKPSPAELRLAEVASRLDQLAKRVVAAEMNAVEAAASGTATGIMGIGAVASQSEGQHDNTTSPCRPDPSASKFKPTEAVAMLKARFEAVSAQARLAT